MYCFKCVCSPSILCSFTDAGSSPSLTGRRFPQNVVAQLITTANVSYDNLSCPEARELLTSFLAIFGVVFLNLDVLKRFMLPSQIDFRAFRESLSSWLVLGRGFLLQLSVQVGREVSARFASRSGPVGCRVFFFTLQRAQLTCHVLCQL